MLIFAANIILPQMISYADERRHAERLISTIIGACAHRPTGRQDADEQAAYGDAYFGRAIGAEDAARHRAQPIYRSHLFRYHRVIIATCDEVSHHWSYSKHNKVTSFLHKAARFCANKPLAR